MEKKCYSVKSLDFEKSIKSLGKNKIDKLYDKIAKLEAMENDHSLLPNGVRSAETMFGKTLNKMGRKNIYVLELGDDRAMAVIIEKEGKKVYAWFWGGSHEDYNKKITNASALHKVENVMNSSTSVNAVQINMDKDKVIDNIKSSKHSAHENKNKKHHYG